MIYDFKVFDTKGNEVSLEKYKGKVLLIVNTATGCGLTPQYEGLQKIYNKYKDQGFELLDFPCNQFFEQAPGTNEEIVSFCQTNYNTTFETFGKLEVNGDNAHELYRYLKKEAPAAKEDQDSEALYDKLKGLGFTSEGEEIKWNFTKFLIDRNGKVVERFAPTVTPEKIGEEIEKLL
ncbi:MAG: glutathione peroxidase [bacterium]|nr:glutathione peroxidase [bacterium]